LCFVLGALAQSRTQVLVIDDYSVSTAPLVITVNSTIVLPATLAAFVQDNNILGGERDLVLTVQSEQSLGRVVSTNVDQNTWSVSTPSEVTSIAFCQYDGVDGSANLNPVGLGGFDLTTSNADSFKVTITADVGTTYTFAVTDTVGGSSSTTVNIPGDPGVSDDFFIQFSTFTGNADFTRAGSVTLTVNAGPNVDTSVNILALAAPNTVPASTTPTPSSTPAATPNASPVPSPPPPPPAFSPTSIPIPPQSWYRFDDDDAEKSPCGEDERPNETVLLADNNVIYYYFYGFQRPKVYIEYENGAGPLLISLFACIVPFFAL